MGEKHPDLSAHSLLNKENSISVEEINGIIKPRHLLLLADILTSLVLSVALIPPVGIDWIDTKQFLKVYFLMVTISPLPLTFWRS